VAGCCECGDEPSDSCTTELVTMATIAYCMGKRTKSIAAFRYRGTIDIF
jgi:hypothetical protein